MSNISSFDNSQKEYLFQQNELFSLTYVAEFCGFLPSLVFNILGESFPIKEANFRYELIF